MYLNILAKIMYKGYRFQNKWMQLDTLQQNIILKLKNT